MDEGLPVQIEAALASWPPSPVPEQSAYACAWWEITAANDRLEKAIGEQVADQAARHYMPDAVLFAPAAPPVRGRRQLRALWQDLFNKGVRSADLKTLDLHGMEEMLVEEGRYALRDEADRILILHMGKYVVVWAKVDGEANVPSGFSKILLYRTSITVPVPAKSSPCTR